MAIDALDADPATRRVVLVSKPPHPEVARAILARVGESAKRFTICFLGGSATELPANATFAPTLRDAAQDALGGKAIAAGFEPPPRSARPGRVVGLFSGGTLCAEAQLILLAAGRSVVSNAPVPGAGRSNEDGATDRIVDLGADEFTRGRPHPMIDPTVRDDELRKALADPGVAVVLVDCIIGFGANADPAGHLAAIVAAAGAGAPPVLASVTGTEGDPQVRSQQIAILERAGVTVAPSNAHAAERALSLCRT